MDLNQYLPPPNEVEQMVPEIVAPLLLRAMYPKNEVDLHRQMPEISAGGSYVPTYVPDDIYQRQRITRKLSEAWNYLYREGLIFEDANSSPGFYLLSGRGKELLESGNFESYRLGNLLPPERLDARLSRKVRIPFLDGDYETAVFAAFKEVEVRVRRKGNLPAELLGTNLMREAFKPGQGVLANLNAVRAEQEALSNMFAGAVGFYKNPASHREVNFEDPEEVAEAIYFANHLIRIVERIEVQNS